jgi:hypothetical protein
MSLLKEEFESSSVETPQFRKFYFAFKADLSRILKEHIDKIEYHKGHFDIYGFFTLKDGRIFYFSVGDVRHWKQDMLVRTAKGYKDWTGGPNGSVTLDDNLSENLLNHLHLKQ